jgi:hypothetical protein
MNWYAAEDKQKSVRQIVICAESPQPVDSKFGLIGLVGMKYEPLRESFWTTGFFRLDGDPGPYLLVKARDNTDRLKAKPFRIAYCFYRMKAGGLISLFVDFPSIKIPGNPYDPFVLFEMTRGLDVDDECKRIADGMSKQPLHLCFGEGAGAGIQASYDVLIEVPSDCQKALASEWKELLNFHHSVTGGRRDFNASVAQMQQENPLSENPILEAPRGQTTQSHNAKSSSQEKPWWGFWK